MIDMQEPQSLFSLWLAQFGVANRTLGKVIKISIILLIPYVLLAAALYALKPSGPIALVFCGILFVLYTLFLAFGSPLMLMRIFAADIEGFPESTSETITRCLLPTLYIIIYQILFGILSCLISFIGNFTRSSIVAGLLNLIFTLCVTIRLVYTAMAIAVREKGPIEGAAYSWQLTSGAGYMRTLGMCFMSVVLPILVVIGGILAFYGLYVGIPLYMPNSFDIANLSPFWYIAGGLVMIVLLFLGLCMSAFPLLVFLNLDNDNYQKQYAAPTPDLVTENSEEDTLNTYPTPGAKADPTPDLEDLTVQRTAVHTQGHESMQEHLDKVYKPQKQEFIQYEDEDRMPTILFDDDMAKQLEENRKMFHTGNADKNENPKPHDDGPSSIKMSK